MTDATAIANDHVVSFHYTLTNAEGETLDQSQGEPLAYLHGAGNIIPGLEKALEGKNLGDKFTVNVSAADGYGEYNPDLVQEVPAQMFQGVDNIEAGMQFQAQTDDGVQIVTVKAIEGENIIVDANFPLAGQDLTFEVEIVEIRDASAEELEHGHVHGAGGHHH
ncbi:FKBP-type peptidyl-prolyl cis-trans isomerase [Acinetobacter pullicarnis]|uniref:FKBP-type peptidyl-prolyl cis-trans isomerase n=1 Tax=Acinetobacter pullicarnis TaxID=2576829 RepID=UPI00111F02E7|nr:peptidylprolyl isomerase [Acinetobacter pullicarnis]